jgi:glycerol uptake facilitator-like aquaporin
VDAIGLPRRLLAEFVGTALLVAVVVGSGIAAAQLSPDDVGLQLLENSTATVFGLAVLILLFGPVSGAHFNPVVTAADWLLGRRAGTGITAHHLAAYLAAQVAGGISGAWLANLMFDRRVFEIATKDRITIGHLVGEVVATAGLIALIFALARTGRAALSAAAVGAYIGAAYWFTSSTSFAIIWTHLLGVNRFGGADAGAEWGSRRRRAVGGTGWRGWRSGAGGGGVLAAFDRAGMLTEHGAGLRVRPAAFLALPDCAGV